MRNRKPLIELGKVHVEEKHPPYRRIQESYCKYELKLEKEKSEKRNEMLREIRGK